MSAPDFKAEFPNFPPLEQLIALESQLSPEQMRAVCELTLRTYHEALDRGKVLGSGGFRVHDITKQEISKIQEILDKYT